MPQLKITFDLDATPDQVWSAVSDPQTWSDWLTIHLRWIQPPPQRLSVGSKLVNKIILLGMPNKVSWTVSELQPPGIITLTGEGIAGLRTTLAFHGRPTNSGTALEITGTTEGRLVEGRFGNAVQRDIRKQLELSMRRLEGYALTHASRPAASPSTGS